MEEINNALLRCSGLGNLMTEPKTKAEKESGILSKTAQSYLNEHIFKIKYNRIKDFSNKYTDKGNEVEQDGIHLLNLIQKKMYRKNKERFENGLVTGCPDIIGKDIIIDIKSNYDFSTFLTKTGIDKDYYWQLCGYCLLTGKRKGAIAYTLNNTPFHLIENEFTSRYYKGGMVDLTDEKKARIALNHIYSDKYIKDGKIVNGYWEVCRQSTFPNSELQFIEIPEEKRLRYYEVEFSDEDFEKLNSAIEKAVEYISQNIESL